MYSTRCVCAALAALLCARGVAAQQTSGGDAAAARVLQVRFEIETSDTAAARELRQGVRFGAEEASRTARMLGLGVEVQPAGGTPDARADVLILAREPGCAGQDTRSEALLVLDVACTGLAAVEACDVNRFFVAGDAGRAQAARGSRIADWDSTLERFGAAQLRDRYRARFHEEMGPLAWRGWMALKIAAETALRAQTTDPARLVEWLSRDGGRFDGHKGAPLRFGALHRLRQPMYEIAADGSVREIPPAAEEEEVRCEQ